jgi:transketolase
MEDTRMPAANINTIRRAADGIRRRVLEHTVKNNGGYLSQACSAAEILSSLYIEVMNLGPVTGPIKPGKFPGVPASDNSGYRTGIEYNGPRSPEYDRFFLTPSQYSLVLYAALIETGRMSADGLDDFNRDGGIVEMIGAEHSPGMEIMSGSLGQGISQATGIAMARRLKKEPGRVVIFMSDGEFQIGQTWEAIQAASFHSLSNVLIYVDCNGYQCDGSMETVMDIEPLDKRLEAFGAMVTAVNGHDIDALVQAGGRDSLGKPHVVLCRTCPWQGLDFVKARMPKFHYVRFTDPDECVFYREQLETLWR